MATMEYAEGVRAWQSQMDAELRGENSAASLVGLFWLNEGMNTLGRSPDCAIRLPERAPRLLGAIEVTDGRATLHIDVGQSVEINGVATPTATVLRSEDEADASAISFMGLRMAIVRKGNRVGLRLWDGMKGQDLPPRTWFEVDEKFRVRALYTGYVTPVKVDLPDNSGKVETGYVQGYVSFKLDGKSNNLDAAELPDARLYLQFSDLTNGVSTYRSGRYLRTEPVLEDGHVFVDFNRAYNPPCAFNPTERCTFAPKGNHLKVAIEAGEKHQPR